MSSRVPRVARMDFTPLVRARRCRACCARMPSLGAGGRRTWRGPGHAGGGGGRRRGRIREGQGACGGGAASAGGQCVPSRRGEARVVRRGSTRRNPVPPGAASACGAWSPAAVPGEFRLGRQPLATTMQLSVSARSSCAGRAAAHACNQRNAKRVSLSIDHVATYADAN